MRRRRPLSWWLLTAALAAGCATSTAPSPAPTTPATLASVPAAASNDATASTSGAGVKRPPAGYKARVREGQTVYCRMEPVSGSRFGKELCWTPEDLKRMLENNKTEVDDLFRKQPACGLEGCGG